MPDRRRPRHGPAGFTLVELLTTVSIVAVLIALAVPGLRSSIELAQASRCSQNLRQIGTGIMAYAQDNNMQLPNSVYPRVPNARGWVDSLFPYVNGDAGVFCCPSAPANVRTIYSLYAYGEMHAYGNPSYGMNEDLYLRPPLSSPPRTQNPDGSYSYISLGYLQIISPSSCVLVADTDNPPAGIVNSHRLYVYDYGAAGNMAGGGLSKRHRKQGNFLWADGHVSSLAPKEAMDNEIKWFSPQKR